LICYAIACSATLIFQCTPISASWSISLRFQPTTHCLSPHIYVSLGLANSVANILTDVLFAVIPIPVVLRLRLNKRGKASLIAVLYLGFNACIAGIFKTRLQVTTVKAMDSAFHNRFQVLYLLELCLRILADSLPTLKPLLAVALGGKRDTEAEVEVEKVHADTSHLSRVPAACGPNPLSSLLWMEATELGHHERNCGAADTSFA
jgi:hypothetical protein